MCFSFVSLNSPVDNFGTMVGENPTPYGILALWAVNGLSIVYWEKSQHPKQGAEPQVYIPKRRTLIQVLPPANANTKSAHAYIHFAKIFCTCSRHHGGREKLCISSATGRAYTMLHHNERCYSDHVAQKWSKTVVFSPRNSLPESTLLSGKMTGKTLSREHHVVWDI